MVKAAWWCSGWYCCLSAVRSWVGAGSGKHGRNIRNSGMCEYNNKKRLILRTNSGHKAWNREDREEPLLFHSSTQTNALLTRVISQTHCCVSLPAVRVTIITCSAALTAQHLVVVTPRVMFITRAAVAARSVFIRGDGSERAFRTEKLVPWNEIWSYDLPRRVQKYESPLLILISPGVFHHWNCSRAVFLLGDEVRNRRLKSRATISMIRRWLTLCWSVVLAGDRYACKSTLSSCGSRELGDSCTDPAE